MPSVEAKPSLKRVYQIMWLVARIGGLAFIVGTYLSGPWWEHSRDSFHLKSDLLMAAFFTAVATGLGIKLYRLLRDSVSIE